MSLYSDTIYSVTTYEDLEDYRNKRTQAIEAHQNAMRNYLLTCINDSGLTSMKVKVKSTNMLGILKVVPSGSTLYPYEIKFYPLKKDGDVSQNSRYIPAFRSWDMLNMTKQLKDCFEAGE